MKNITKKFSHDDLNRQKKSPTHQNQIRKNTIKFQCNYLNSCTLFIHVLVKFSEAGGRKIQIQVLICPIYGRLVGVHYFKGLLGCVVMQEEVSEQPHSIIYQGKSFEINLLRHSS